MDTADIARRCLARPWGQHAESLLEALWYEAGETRDSLAETLDCQLCHSCVELYLDLEGGDPESVRMLRRLAADDLEGILYVRSRMGLPPLV